MSCPDWMGFARLRLPSRLCIRRLLPRYLAAMSRSRMAASSNCRARACHGLPSGTRTPPIWAASPRSRAWTGSSRSWRSSWTGPIRPPPIASNSVSTNLARSSPHPHPSSRRPGTSGDRSRSSAKVPRLPRRLIWRGAKDHELRPEVAWDVHRLRHRRAVEGARLGPGRLSRRPGGRGGHRALRRPVPAGVVGELRLRFGHRVRTEHAPALLHERWNILLRLHARERRPGAPEDPEDPTDRTGRATDPGQARDGHETLRRQPRRGRSRPREVRHVHVGRQRSPLDRGPHALRELWSLRGRRVRDVHAVRSDVRGAGLHEARLGLTPQGHQGGLASGLRMSGAGSLTLAIYRSTE